MGVQVVCYGTLLLFIGLYQCNLVSASTIVEQGKSASMECQLASNVQSLVWRVWDNVRLNYTDLSTCNVTAGQCVDQSFAVYMATVQTSAGTNSSVLNVSSANINQTNFVCVPDTGMSTNFTLEVYIWPTTISCSQRLNNIYYLIQCRVEEVYPNGAVTIGWSPRNALSREDFNLTACNISVNSKGSFAEDCYFGIPISNMSVRPLTFQAACVAVVSNLSQVSNSPVFSNNVSFTLGGFNPVIDQNECPVGPGVMSGEIPRKSTATCRCQVPQVGLVLVVAQAHWFNSAGQEVGQINSTDRSATLTLSYNDTDSKPIHQCRALSKLKDYYYLEFKPTFFSESTIVEQGKSASMECQLATDVKSLVWRVWDNVRLNYSDLSTCNVTAGQCVDRSPAVYMATVQTSAGSTRSVLNVSSANINQTNFVCVPDTGMSTNFTLEVYVWPTQISCLQRLSNTYYLIQCRVEEVYPNGAVTIGWAPRNALSREDFNLTACNISVNSKGSYAEDCFFGIPISNMSVQPLTFQAACVAVVSNQSQVSNSPVFSNNVSLTLGGLNPVIDQNECPVGPGLVSGEIPSKSTATCRCQVPQVGLVLVVAQAHWFNSAGQEVGQINTADRSATLTLSYNNADPKPTYQCRALSKLKDYYYLEYQPKFFSSAGDMRSTTVLVTGTVLTAVIFLSSRR